MKVLVLGIIIHFFSGINNATINPVISGDCIHSSTLFKECQNYTNSESTQDCTYVLKREVDNRLDNVFTAELDDALATVYLCGGEYSKKYHNTSNCRGLNNCKGGVYRTSMNDAKQRGRTACKICY